MKYYLGLLVLLSLVMTVCRFEENNKDQRKLPNRPKLVSKNNEVLVGRSPIQVNLLKEKMIIVNLDQIPGDNYGTTSILGCYEPFPSDEQLGTVSCVADQAIKSPLMGAHVQQYCSYGPDVKAERRVAPDLSDCHGDLEIKVFEFVPSLRVNLL